MNDNKIKKYSKCIHFYKLVPQIHFLLFWHAVISQKLKCVHALFNLLCSTQRFEVHMSCTSCT